MLTSTQLGYISRDMMCLTFPTAHYDSNLQNQRSHLHNVRQLSSNNKLRTEPWQNNARPAMIESSIISMLLSGFSMLQANPQWGKTDNSIKPLGSHSYLYWILNRAGFWLSLKQLRACNARTFTLKTNDRLELKNNHFCSRIKWHAKQLKYTIYQILNSKSTAVTIIHNRALQRM